MSQTEKAAYYKALQQAGHQFDRHYRDYTTEDLRTLYTETRPGEPPPAIPEPAAVEEPPPADFFFPPAPEPAEPAPPPAPPLDGEMAAERLNTTRADEPIRVDSEGRVWYQEEVRKPAYPKPRGRRVLTYLDPGVEQQSIRVGDYVETFEVAGTGAPRTAEVKITLPSYQVGIYKDPRFPFKVHVYNGQQGFDLFDVQDFYGGGELVPPTCLRVYVENVLCYDIRSVVRTIESEFRQLQLAGKIE